VSAEFDGDDLGDLRHVEQRGDAGHEVLAAGGGRSQQVSIGSGMGDHQRRQVFGRLIGVVRRIGDQHRLTPATRAAAAAAAAQALPATSRWISLPAIFVAAVTALSVAALSELWSCSAMTRMAMVRSPLLRS
jgi:hypothetical protein